MSAVPAERPHGGEWRAPGTQPGESPIVRQVLARVDESLTDLARLGELPLGDGDVVRVLDALTTASSRLTRELCRAAAEADRRRLGDATGARHTHQWWAARPVTPTATLRG